MSVQVVEGFAKQISDLSDDLANRLAQWRDILEIREPTAAVDQNRANAAVSGDRIQETANSLDRSITTLRHSLDVLDATFGRLVGSERATAPESNLRSFTPSAISGLGRNIR